MTEVLIALAALAGVVSVALSGLRFIRRDDAAFDDAVQVDFPALWGSVSTDEVMSR